MGGDQLLPGALVIVGADGTAQQIELGPVPDGEGSAHAQARHRKHVLSRRVQVAEIGEARLLLGGVPEDFIAELATEDSVGEIGAQDVEIPGRGAHHGGRLRRPGIETHLVDAYARSFGSREGGGRRRDRGREGGECRG
jgi:hypothetical protein